MRLQGLHHITAITADAQANVDFYVGLLGLRMVKKTVNFDAPDVYHLYYGDERGHPGSVLTFFEFPGAARGRAGDGTVRLIQWRVADGAALDFWSRRLQQAGVSARRDDGSVRFADPEGLAHELLAVDVPDEPLIALAADIPAELALRGFHGVRAYAHDPARSATLLRDLGFEGAGASSDPWLLGGETRRATLAYDEPPDPVAVQGAGSVHHVAWAAADDAELLEGRAVAVGDGRHATDVIDRQYFHSVYFREPSGVLFELATLPPGFTVDEPVETLGEALKLPPQYESRRAQLQRVLTPLHNPRGSGSPAAGDGVAGTAEPGATGSPSRVGDPGP
jgi:glyoxalase family protein